MKIKGIVISLAMSGYLSAINAHAVTVSPPSWWVGMKDNHLQLMINENAIGNATLSTKYEGVEIESISPSSNPDYLFVNLLIREGALPGTVTFDLTGEGLATSTFDFELSQRQVNADQQRGFNATDTIYLITPDRFANGDLSNDSVEGYVDKLSRNNKGGRHGGDIQGFIDHLDYINQMGFTQIWSMPLLENAMDSYSYHGYAITDYYQIDPRYGSNEQYKQLSEAASQQGIGLIMDMVLNHIGSGHPWLANPPDKDWIHHNGEFSATTHIREALHDPHGTDYDKRAFSDGWFVPSMPDLNQSNDKLATYLIQNAIWWVEYAQLSGIRVDTYSYSDKAFLSAWTARLTEEYPNLNIVGEEWSVNPIITSYWQAGTARKDGYVSSLPSVMDFPFQQALVKGLNEKESWSDGLKKLYELFASDFIYGDAGNLVIFPDNHDMSRIFTQLDQDVTLWKMAMTVVLTTRGIPQIFYGTEILMDNAGTEDHGVIRQDFPGGWEGDEVNAFSGQHLTDAQRDAQSFVKSLLSLRKAYPALMAGEMTQYVPFDGTYVYFRHAENSDTQIMVVINKDEEKEVDLQRFAERLENAKQIQQYGTTDTTALGQSLILPGKQASVWLIK